MIEFEELNPTSRAIKMVGPEAFERRAKLYTMADVKAFKHANPRWRGAGIADIRRKLAGIDLMREIEETAKEEAENLLDRVTSIANESSEVRHEPEKKKTLDEILADLHKPGNPIPPKKITPRSVRKYWCDLLTKHDHISRILPMTAKEGGQWKLLLAAIPEITEMLPLIAEHWKSLLARVNRDTGWNQQVKPSVDFLLLTRNRQSVVEWYFDKKKSLTREAMLKAEGDEDKNIDAAGNEAGFSDDNEPTYTDLAEQPKKRLKAPKIKRELPDEINEIDDDEINDEITEESTTSVDLTKRLQLAAALVAPETEEEKRYVLYGRAEDWKNPDFRNAVLDLRRNVKG